MLASHHSMDLNFFMDTIEVFFANVADFDDFASIDSLGRINCRPDSLLLRAPTSDILHQILGQLSLADLSILAHTEHIVQKYNEVVDFSYLGRLLSSASPGPPSTCVLLICLLLWSSVLGWYALGVAGHHARLVTTVVR